MASTFEREQARAIRAAQSAERALSAWSVTVNQGMDRRIVVVFAVTARGAASIALSLGGVVRVGPASVRNLPAAIERALAASPVLAPSVPPVSERERARLYLRGAAERPADAAVYAVLGSVVKRRALGEPRKPLTVHVPPAPLAPIVGEYTLSGGRRAA